MTATAFFDDDDRESWAEFRAEIDRRLDLARPDRASVGETDWRQPTYGWARNHLPNETTIVRRVAKQEVDNRERQATKRGNDYLRRYLKGQAPLEWGILGPLPIKVGKLRVRFDAATPNDVEDAARQLMADGKATYDAVLILGEGLLDMARDARRSGYAVVRDLGDLPLRDDGRFADLDWDDEQDQDD